MKSIIVTISIIITLAFNLNAAEKLNTKADIQLKMYKAYVTDNTVQWLDAMNELEKTYLQTKSKSSLYDLTRSQYGYIGLLIDRAELEKAKKILPKAEQNAQKLVNDNPESADAHALLAGIYGFKIILYPNYVIINGPKGKNYIEKASSGKNSSASVMIEMGNYAYHTPSILGGNINDAIDYYKKAIRFMETKKTDKNNWQYLNTMVWLAISYDKIGKYDQAIQILKTVLEKEPELAYVKNDLYPRMVKKESISKTYYSMK